MTVPIYRIIGVLGVIFSIMVMVEYRTFPTPDKLIVAMTFVFMIFGQAREMLKKMFPFAVLLIVYDSFRSIAPLLNQRVNYDFMPWADRLMFGGELPTKILQNLLWSGTVHWYDFVFQISYMLHFVLPFVLALIIWKKRENFYWIFVSAYVAVSFAGFITFVLFPACPPWLASDMGLIETIPRISSYIFHAAGVQNFVSIYNNLSPNHVAAIPSLHAAYGVLFGMYVTRLWKSIFRYLSWVYPALIFVGTVYMSEHYVIDLIIGAVYAVAAYYAAPYIVTFFYNLWRGLMKIPPVADFYNFLKGVGHRITG